MKKSKLLFISLIITILHVFTYQSLYSQKLKFDIDPNNGDTTYTIKLFQLTYWCDYYCHLQKNKDDFILEFQMRQGAFDPFEIAEDKPIEFLLSSNDTLKFNSISQSLAIDHVFDNPLTGIGSKVNYTISIDDILKIHDSNLIWIKTYFYPDPDRTTKKSFLDENGRYFKLEFQKVMGNHNKKINKRITKFLDGINFNSQNNSR